MKTFPYTQQAQFIFKSILAGILIAMAGGIYLGCADKTIGAFLFSIGLIAVIILEANLFTGKIGYVDSWRKANDAIGMLIFNLLAAFLVGLLYKGINPAILPGPFGPESLRCEKEWYKMFFDGFGCGVLIYLAVELYKRTKSVIPVILCVAAFILSGAEHCIADAFYLGASEVSLKAVGYLGLTILGNSIGSIAIHWLHVGVEKKIEIPTNL